MKLGIIFKRRPKRTVLQKGITILWPTTTTILCYSSSAVETGMRFLAIRCIECFCCSNKVFKVITTWLYFAAHSICESEHFWAEELVFRADNQGDVLTKGIQWFHGISLSRKFASLISWLHSITLLRDYIQNGTHLGCWWWWDVSKEKRLGDILLCHFSKLSFSLLCNRKACRVYDTSHFAGQYSGHWHFCSN